MLDAIALCGYNRVKSGHMVSTEPQSQSKGALWERRQPLASGTLVKSPGEVGVQVPRGLQHPLGTIHGQ
jgi:hypothetical protein